MVYTIFIPNTIGPLMQARGPHHLGCCPSLDEYDGGPDSLFGDSDEPSEEAESEL